MNEQYCNCNGKPLSYVYVTDEYQSRSLFESGAEGYLALPVDPTRSFVALWMTAFIRRVEWTDTQKKYRVFTVSYLPRMNSLCNRVIGLLNGAHIKNH